MAFTVAHMAAALPFHRSSNRYNFERWLQFDALLIGTMIPDLPYYIGSSDATGDLSHQWIGLVAYCLPWGILVFAIWYWLLKPAVYALILPFLRKPKNEKSTKQDTHVGQNPVIQNSAIQNSAIQNSVSQRQYKGQRQIIGYADRSSWFTNFRKRAIQAIRSFYLPVVFGLLLGAATHVVWDGITHADGLIARHIDWLQYPIYFYPFKGTSVARLLQYLTSIAGLVILLWFAISRLKDRQRMDHKNVSGSRLNRNRLHDLKPVFTKKQSLAVVSFIFIVSLALFIQAVITWYPSMIGSPYNLAAKVSVSVLQDVALLCIGYALVFHLLYFLRNIYIERYGT